MSNEKDDLGDRLKQYEFVTTGRKAFKGQPIVVRLDGKNFHNFTKGLNRPYDEDLSNLMCSTMQFLVKKFNPLVGYTQSDEITLVWYLPSDSQSEYEFAGRFQKIDSLLAANTSVYFNQKLPEYLPDKAHQGPVFDCRTFVVPNLLEAYHVLLWRQQDATKNAISMAAQSMFSHKSLQGLHGSEMQEKMFSEKGINFNDYPDFFKRGTFCRRVQVEKELDEETLKRIKPEHRPTGPVMRSDYPFSNEWLTKLENPVDFLFNNAEASYKIIEQEAG